MTIDVRGPVTAHRPYFLRNRIPPLRQSKSQIRITRFASNLSATAGNDNVLLAVEEVRCRCCVSSSWQLMFPNYFSGMFIKGSDLFIFRSCDKNQASFGNKWATVVFCSSRWYSFGSKL